MKLRYFMPLAAHVVATVAIGFGQVIPGSCIAGVNALTGAFVASIVSTCVAYWVGMRMVAQDRRSALEPRAAAIEDTAP
jgi:hypothetical protein